MSAPWVLQLSVQAIRPPVETLFSLLGRDGTAPLLEPLVCTQEVLVRVFRYGTVLLRRFFLRLSQTRLRSTVCLVCARASVAPLRGHHSGSVSCLPWRFRIHSLRNRGSVGAALLLQNFLVHRHLLRLRRAV